MHLPLAQQFYERPTPDVARDLLGKRLVRIWNGQILSGVIVETEAYCGVLDPASHAYRSKTARNSAMFGPAGTSYVYFSYGIHHCLNIVAKEPGAAAGAVLLRSLVPLEGIPIMQKLRGLENIDRLTSGPGNICSALALTLSHNNINLTHTNALYVTEGPLSPYTVAEVDIIHATPRIGISKAQDKLWRFVIPRKIG